MFEMEDSGVLKKNQVFLHPKYKLFIKRFTNSVLREKLSRENPENSTPSSIITANKYIFSIRKDQPIFLLVPNFLFEELIFASWEISKGIEIDNLGAENLLKELYSYEPWRKLINWKNYSWTENFEEFKNHLVEESFFYFDDGENSYYFNLFRQIKNDEFIGGFLHFLTGHYINFNKFKLKSKDSNDFFYNHFIFKLINASIYGGEVSRENKAGQNILINKELAFEDGKSLRVGLYYDYQKNLYYINTAFIKS